MIEIAIHEIGHILGLTSEDMPYYYDRTTGLPRTTRPLKVATDVECIDGRIASDFDYEIFLPSKDTLAFGAMYPGIKYYEVVTPTVRQVAQNHFACEEMRGMRLENQPTSNGKEYLLRVILLRCHGVSFLTMSNIVLVYFLLLLLPSS